MYYYYSILYSFIWFRVSQMCFNFARSRGKGSLSGRFNSNYARFDRDNHEKLSRIE